MDLHIYEVRPAYIDYLLPHAPHIFRNPSNIHSTSRKYIGIVLKVNGLNYFIAMSSFKPKKHKKMRESVDFIKIRECAVININNMIPIPDGQYRRINISIVKDPHYRALLREEYRAIKVMQGRIRKNAEIVYNHKLRYGNSTLLAKRTNDFPKLEEMCKRY